MSAPTAGKAAADYMLEGLLQRLEPVQLNADVIVAAGLDDIRQRHFSEGWQQKRGPGSRLVALAEAGDGTGDLVVGMAPPDMDPTELAPRLRSCLKIGGCLMFACLGPGTAQELNSGEPAGDKEPISCRQRPVLTDMHNLGDALQLGGFVSLVVESERMLWTHSDFHRWRDDLAQLGFLLDGDAGAQSEERKSVSAETGPAPWSLSVEIVYAHGWAADPSQARADGDGDQPLLDLRRALGYGAR